MRYVKNIYYINKNKPANFAGLFLFYFINYIV